MNLKKLFLLATVLILNYKMEAQIKAVTSDGEEVLLYDDGSWKYASKKDAPSKAIPIIEEPFSYSKESTFLVKSKVVKFGVQINPKVWSFEKGEDGGAAEYSFQLKGKDAYGMLICERLDISVESLKSIAYKNGLNAAPDLKITKEEYRTVNGLKILFMQMEGTIEGMEFVYCGYYYASELGSVQFLTYTSKKLLTEHFSTMESLLNGFVSVE